MKKILLSIIVLIALIGCQVTKKSSEHKAVKTFTQKTDSTSSVQSHTAINESQAIKYISVPDYASITALIECNEKGEAYIKEITDLKAGNQVKPSFRIKNNYIEIECRVDSFQVYQIMKNRYDTLRSQTIIKTDTSGTVNSKIETDKNTKFKFGPSFTNIFISLFLAAFAFVVFRWARKNGYI